MYQKIGKESDFIIDMNNISSYKQFGIDENLLNDSQSYEDSEAENNSSKNNIIAPINKWGNVNNVNNNLIFLVGALKNKKRGNNNFPLQ